MRKELARHRSKETNTTGDGCLAIFDIADQVVKTTSLISSQECFFSLHPMFCGYASCLRIFTTFSIVFQLRVVTGTPSIFSILPR